MGGPQLTPARSLKLLDGPLLDKLEPEGAA